MRNKRLLGAVRRLTEFQLDALVDMLDGAAALLYIESSAYAVHRENGAWIVRPLDSEHRYVTTAEGCTCPTGKYRGHCKHMKAMVML